MSLEEYRRKRRLAETPEPAGSTRPPDLGCIFVVQKHAARRLHYDFRLAIKGVLASWAVPRGPSMNPADKRLAIRTEDHPLEYADFEGVIPAGQYGAGTVMVWDRGEYRSKDNIPPAEQLARGKIDIDLQGQKLCGGFTLVRTATRARPAGTVAARQAPRRACPCVMECRKSRARLLGPYRSHAKGDRRGPSGKKAGADVGPRAVEDRELKNV